MTRLLLATGLALTASVSAPALPFVAPALAQAVCDVWTTYDEQDGTVANLTAVACSSTANDSSAVGLQCVGKRPEVRYYPGNGAQQTLRDGTVLTITFAVGEQSVDETSRYDGREGVFAVHIGRNDALLQMLQSGGPLDVSSDTLDTHRFRLVGSTAAIAKVLGQCGVTTYIGPPPPPPADPDADQ